MSLTSNDPNNLKHTDIAKDTTCDGANFYGHALRDFCPEIMVENCIEIAEQHKLTGNKSLSNHHENLI